MTEYWNSLTDFLSNPVDFLAIAIIVPSIYLLSHLVLHVFRKPKKNDERWGAVIFTRHAPFYELAQDSNRRFDLPFYAKTADEAQNHVQSLLKEGVVICHKKTQTFVFVPPDNILAIELNRN